VICYLDWILRLWFSSKIILSGLRWSGVASAYGWVTILLYCLWWNEHTYFSKKHSPQRETLWPEGMVTPGNIKSIDVLPLKERKVWPTGLGFLYVHWESLTKIEEWKYARYGWNLLDPRWIFLQLNLGKSTKCFGNHIRRLQWMKILERKMHKVGRNHIKGVPQYGRQSIVGILSPTGDELP